jgi:hypothetical protein
MDDGAGDIATIAEINKFKCSSGILENGSEAKKFRATQR